MLEMILTNKEELVLDIEMKGSLLKSGHCFLEFMIEESQGGHTLTRTPDLWKTDLQRF